MMTTQEMQDRMPKDAEGHLLCEGCGVRATKGWVYHFGAIVLATCGKPRCQPRDPKWRHAMNFVRAPKKTGHQLRPKR
jgi:hypothetical protein